MTGKAVSASLLTAAAMVPGFRASIEWQTRVEKYLRRASALGLVEGRAEQILAEELAFAQTLADRTPAVALDVAADRVTKELSTRYGRPGERDRDRGGQDAMTPIEYGPKLMRHAVLGTQPSTTKLASALERRGLGELRGHNPDWIWNRRTIEGMTLPQLESLYAEVTTALLHRAQLFVGGPMDGQHRTILYGDRASFPDPDGGFAEYEEIEVLANDQYLGHVWIYATLTPELRKEAITRHLMAASCKEPHDPLDAAAP